MVALPLNVNSPPPRDRSYGARLGANESLAVRPAPAHCEGSVRVVSFGGAPLSSTQGELMVGSVRPSEKFSVNVVLLMLPPTLTLCTPMAYDTSPLAPTLVSRRF